MGRVDSKKWDFLQSLGNYGMIFFQVLIKRELNQSHQFPPVQELGAAGAPTTPCWKLSPTSPLYICNFCFHLIHKCSILTGKEEKTKASMNKIFKKQIINSWQKEWIQCLHRNLTLHFFLALKVFSNRFRDLKG